MSNLFKGTKGKWEVVHNSFINDVKCGDSTIATVFNNGGLSAGEANAQLIATAPELLKAAYKMIGVLIAQGFDHEFNACDRAVFDDLQSAVYKALSND